jgi:3-oxoacyl-[acyl-carrier protein] reductase/2-[hydroxy(phenyl)methyl]-succinyl-CoA dehydrogenase BbsC subunit
MKGKIAVITGAGSEVGRAIAARFAENGATLVLVDSDRHKLDAVVGTLGAGVRTEVVTLDASDEHAVRFAVRRVVEGFGGIDILVNNVDCRDGVGLAEATVENWQRSLQQNLLPVVSFSLQVIPVMKQKKYGRIVTVGSLDYLGSAGQANYSAAKSALFGLTRSLALELAKNGITVNQVLKGDIAGEAGELSPEEEQKKVAQIPVQRLGKPEEVAHVVSYLAADTSGYVTGQNLIVCGGKSVYSSMSA